MGNGTFPDVLKVGKISPIYKKEQFLAKSLKKFYIQDYIVFSCHKIGSMKTSMVFEKIIP